MTPRFYCALALAIVLPAAAQQPAAKIPDPKVAKNVLRAADGHPDMSGLWTNVWITPLERPRNLANKEFFTPALTLQVTGFCHSKNPPSATGTPAKAPRAQRPTSLSPITISGGIRVQRLLRRSAHR